MSPWLLILGLAASLVDDGEQQLAAGQFAAALATLDRAAKEAPRDPRPRYLRGLALAKLGRPADAARAYREALALDPKLAKVRNELAIALEDAGLVDAALVEWRRAVGDDPKLEEAWVSWERALTGRRDASAALKVLDDAIRVLPDDLDLRIDRADVLRSLGRYEGALIDLAVARRLQPRSLAVRLDLIRVLVAAKRCGDARRELAPLPPAHPEVVAIGKEVAACKP
jgi:Flp pilus assembly protein TadD